MSNGLNVAAIAGALGVAVAAQESRKPVAYSDS